MKSQAQGLCNRGLLRSSANAIAIRIRRAGAATDAQGVELVAIAVAISSWDSRAAAGINLAGTVANPAGVEGAHAVVDIVANAVAIRIRSAGRHRRPRRRAGCHHSRNPPLECPRSRNQRQGRGLHRYRKHRTSRCNCPRHHRCRRHPHPKLQSPPQSPTASVVSQVPSSSVAERHSCRQTGSCNLEPLHRRIRRRRPNPPCRCRRRRPRRRAGCRRSRSRRLGFPRNRRHRFRRDRCRSRRSRGCPRSRRHRRICRRRPHPKCRRRHSRQWRRRCTRAVIVGGCGIVVARQTGPCNLVLLHRRIRRRHPNPLCRYRRRRPRRPAGCRHSRSRRIGIPAQPQA